MRKAQWFVVVFLVLFAARAYAGDAVTDLGITKGEPIETGFLFVDGKYLDAPYVVERRGVSIYVNNIMIRKGPEYPPYDYRVETDPGDPPPDVSPTEPPPPGVDGRDTYWGKKGRYIFQHYDEETARGMAIETYKKSPYVKEVIAYADDPVRVTLVDLAGKHHHMGLWVPPEFLQAPPTREEILKQAEDSRVFYENRLKGDCNTALFRRNGAEVGLSREKALDVINVLLTAKTADERLKGFESALSSKQNANWLQDIVGDFQASPQLAERYSAAKAAWDARKSRPDRQTWQ